MRIGKVLLALAIGAGLFAPLDAEAAKARRSPNAAAHRQRKARKVKARKAAKKKVRKARKIARRPATGNQPAR